MNIMYANWVDLVIVVACGVLVWRGIQDGLTTQVLSTAGFFGGLFLGGWLFPKLLPIHDHTLLTIVNGNLVLLLATVLAIAGFTTARRIHYKVSNDLVHKTSSFFSIFFSLTVGLLTAWLVGSMLGRLPFVGLSNSANDSIIIQELDRHLPPVPSVFAAFNKQIDPNTPPLLFIKSNLQTEAVVPVSSQAMKAAAAQDEKSVVRITSFGCYGIISGSGFFVAPDLVMTNAHVIAGVKNPVIKYQNQSYAGTPVYFDPNLDLAFLHIENFSNGLPLGLTTQHIPAGTPVVVLGYPGGNYTVLPGVIRDELQTIDPNLYGFGGVDRSVYEVQVAVSQGNSGGPLILTNGLVAGLVFAKSGVIKDYGYALTSASIDAKIQQALKTSYRVGTGACLNT